ncbi:alpha/beta fold hydrolase [Stackebrandtia endophytica]|uniref:alpha/beta hydrolase family protein n=1 Tax=Stackebrandtia endophytica TaxID=1496996 RepID=UPI001151E756|nr:alpha/beta fold hydrolase [Stackebrandtia endophytica]
MSTSTDISGSEVVAALTEVTGHGTTVVSVAPVVLDAPGRPLPLEVRASAPVTGDRLPVLLFSHGNGWSLDGYAPLTSYWASQGFVVVQPTHLDSRRNGIGFDDERFGSIWTRRRHDLIHILEQLDVVEAAVPGLAGRIDRDTVVAAGHSWGAQTVQMLLGARVINPDGTLGIDYRDDRVSAGVLLAATGVGGPELSPFAAEHLPFMNPSFAQLTTSTLVVAGDHDQSKMSIRGPDWFTDAYTLSPGATDLLTLFGAEHSLGGIPNYEAAETTDENPERVAVLQRLTTAYLRSVVTRDPSLWEQARKTFSATGSTIGRIESKRHPEPGESEGENTKTPGIPGVFIGGGGGI